MSDRQRYDVVQPRHYVNADGEPKTAWTRIGSAWEGKGGGWSAILDALPLPSLSKDGLIETRILIMPPKAPSAGQTDADDSIPY